MDREFDADGGSRDWDGPGRRSGPVEQVEVAVLGAGCAGLAVGHRLAQAGIHDLLIFERDAGVGGTWRANSYPGAACDVPSHLYSLSFAPNPYWSRSYAAQPEILRYVEDCYDRFDLRRKVRTGTCIDAAAWSAREQRWRLWDAEGKSYSARVLVSATGMFHTPARPDLPGLDDFPGPVFHSARWDHECDLAGRRVAVIGTGASAIQVVPAIAGRTAQLDLYQRSAPWVLPRRDEPYSAEQQREFAAHPETMARHRRELHDSFEQTTAFLADDPMAAAIAAVAREYLARKVADPALRARLTPDYPFGCKRTLISSDFYPALQRDNVELITDPIAAITPTGIRTAGGNERRADVIVLCTGFRAADYLHGLDLVGRGGVTIHDHWAGVPRAYHGIAVPRFPNFFMLYGPNTNQGGNSILLMLEAQAQFLASALAAMGARGAATLEVTPEALKRYCFDLERNLATTVWAGDCATYFHNAAGDIVTQLPHTSGWYREATQAINCDDFVFGGAICTTS